MLLIDDREHPPLVQKVMEAVPEASVQRLPVGDYLLFDQCGHSIGTEGNMLADLLKSLAGGKVSRQVGALVQFDRGILLIEGRWDVKSDGKMYVHGRLVGWRAQSVQAILLSLQEKIGVKVLHTNNWDETAIVLKMLDSRGEKGCFWPKGEDHESAA